MVEGLVRRPDGCSRGAGGDVLLGREYLIKLDSLKLATESGTAAVVRCPAVKGAAPERDRAGSPGVAADAVDERGLAGTVGADETEDLALTDGDGDVVDGHHGAVVDADAVQLQNQIGRAHV